MSEITCATREFWDAAVKRSVFVHPFHYSQLDLALQGASVVAHLLRGDASATANGTPMFNDYERGGLHTSLEVLLTAIGYRLESIGELCTNDALAFEAEQRDAAKLKARVKSANCTCVDCQPDP